MAINNQELMQWLRQGLDELGLDSSKSVVEPLLHYIDLLCRWNRSYNLTAIRDPHAMITRHLLDSLAVIPYIEGPLLVDVGTGAGLPGLPLALLRPELDWVLVDSNAKKTRFVTQALAELGLNNIRVVKARVAEFALDVRANTVISRAFSDLPAFIDAAEHLCCDGGQLLAMKAAVTAAELQRLPAKYHAEQIPLQVPGLAEQRCIIKIVHKS